MCELMSFSVLTPIFKNFVMVIIIIYKKILSTGKFGLAPWFFFTFEQYFLFFTIAARSSYPDPQKMNADPKPCF